MAGHYLTASQWALPTAEHYAKMQAYANRSGGDFLRREYEELHREYEELRREYEELRREYEELRRPFDARKGPRTDVWDYPIVTAQERHHVAQKPVLMMAAMIEQSTRPGAVVLDSFMGSGSTGVACMMTGRRFLGIERDPEYLAIARARISQRRTRPRPIFSPPPRRQPPTAQEVRPMLTPEQELAEIKGVLDWGEINSGGRSAHRQICDLIQSLNASKGRNNQLRQGVEAAVDECRKWQAHHTDEAKKRYWQDRADLFQFYLTRQAEDNPNANT